MILMFFSFTFHGRVSVTPLIPCNIKFVQRGFIERAAFEERISRVGREFTVYELERHVHIAFSLFPGCQSSCAETATSEEHARPTKMSPGRHDIFEN
jgi:hypothetical protein